MAHFAELDENNVVLRVTCVGDDEVAYNGDPAGETYCTKLLGGTSQVSTLFLEGKQGQKREYSHIIWSIYFRDFRRDITERILIKQDNQIKYNVPFTEEDKKQKCIKQYSRICWAIIYI